jgi:hypothetical protein
MASLVQGHAQGKGGLYVAPRAVSNKGDDAHGAILRCLHLDTKVGIRYSLFIDQTFN